MAVVQKIRCRVAKVIDHGDHVYSLDLVPERPVPRFRPGQFLHLALDEYEPSGFWPESRVFSIASPPPERSRLRLAYSVRGRYTGRMEKELAEGRALWIKMPYGDFVVESSKDVVLLAGGTGITAFTAFLGGLPADHPHSVYLGYGARSKRLLIFRSQMEELGKKIPRLKTFYFTENDPGILGAARTADGLPEYPGCVSAEALWPLIQNPLGAGYYLSGPPGMIRTLSHDLRERGVPPEEIRVDAWD